MLSLQAAEWGRWREEKEPEATAREGARWCLSEVRADAIRIRE